MRLYIIRHADPDYENDSLTAAGHLEAQALARRLQTLQLTHIYSSPLGRAMQTMAYALDLIDVKPQIIDWVQEIPDNAICVPGYSPPNERMAAWNIPGERIRNGTPVCADDPWRDVPELRDSGMPEKVRQLGIASDGFLSRHGYVRQGGRYRRQSPNSDAIAVFCHNGFGLTWLAHLLEIPVTLMWIGFWLPPSSLTTILFEERTDIWAVPRCLGLGDVSHLYEANLPVQPAGITANYV